MLILSRLLTFVDDAVAFVATYVSMLVLDGSSEETLTTVAGHFAIVHLGVSIAANGAYSLFGVHLDQFLFCLFYFSSGPYRFYGRFGTRPPFTLCCLLLAKEAEAHNYLNKYLQ